MTDDILEEIRSSTVMKNAIIGSMTLYRANDLVNINLITDLTYGADDKDTAYNILRKYVPQEFSLVLEITKVTPDAAMVRDKIFDLLTSKYPLLSAGLKKEDVAVTAVEGGFNFVISTIVPPQNAVKSVEEIERELKKHYCGNFYGKAVKAQRDASSFEIEKVEEEPIFVFTPRTFPVTKFVPIESLLTEAPERAVYIADFAYVSEETFVCGYIKDISERSYTSKTTGEEKPYYIYTLSDGTGTISVTYFARKKSLEKIKALAVGEGIVCRCKSENRNGFIRYTAVKVDRGMPPEDFKPEKRPSKPTPLYYHCVKPQPFTDITQSDFFTDDSIPDYFKGRDFVVFDLETTGLNSSPIGGDMDGIIEIGAFKVTDGVIKEKFSTFVNPLRGTSLPKEIIELTGITNEQVNSAPSYKEVLPDFVKFCDGATLVGHNVVNFDFRFIDYYTRELDYNIECELIDTLTLSQQLLRSGEVANHKLNSVADYFGITFNHHRAEDDALATAKIFIRLIKLKNSSGKLS